MKVIKGEKALAFDKEETIASIRKTEVHGSKAYPMSCWPSVDELKAKSEETLNQLRITKVEWNVPQNCAIYSLRFTLSDGTVSKKIGRQVNLKNSFEFSKERPIRSIRVNENGSHVYKMVFLDGEGKIIVEIKG